jgi:hypothetical protein
MNMLGQPVFPQPPQKEVEASQQYHRNPPSPSPSHHLAAAIAAVIEWMLDWAKFSDSVALDFSFRE